MFDAYYISGLFPYIKMECDRAEENGRFCLTGSPQYHLMQNVSESLAGRIAVLELSGLSLREMQGISLSEPFVPTQEYIEKREKEYRNCKDIWRVIHRGGYPALANKDVDWQTFFGSYIQTYIDRDINQLTKVQDKIRRHKNGKKAELESEIDLIVEQNGILYPVEIKLSANPRPDMTNAFDILDRIPDKKRGTGAIICMYDKPLWLKANIVALPVEFI